jgi:NADH:ubiquinone oxidoreductase subunit C
MSNEETLFQSIKARAEVIEVRLTSVRRILATVAPENYFRFVGFLKDSGVSHVIAITCIDMCRNVEVLLHLGRKTIVTVRVLLSTEKPEIDSLASILPGVVIHEREIHEMMGINIKNSPDLSRFLLSEDWPEGVYPLRKSFVAKTPDPVRRD